MSQMSCQLARSDWSAADDAMLVLSASSNASAGSCSFNPSQALWEGRQDFVYQPVPDLLGLTPGALNPTGLLLPATAAAAAATCLLGVPGPTVTSQVSGAWLAANFQATATALPTTMHASIKSMLTRRHSSAPCSNRVWLLHL